MNRTAMVVNSIAALRRHSRQVRGLLCKLAAKPRAKTSISQLADAHEILLRTEARLLGCSGRLLESEETEPTKGNEP